LSQPPSTTSHLALDDAPALKSEVEPAASVLSCSVAGRTAPKPNNDYFDIDSRRVWRGNEDRVRITEWPDSILAAVADGAGGSGLFCGAWAETLLQHLPMEPLCGWDDLNGWLDGFWEVFRAEYAEQAAADPVRRSKFVREGSCATLMACWLRLDQELGASVHWLAYGDSPFLVFDRSGDGMRLVQHHPPTLNTFDQDPRLLNWKDIPDACDLRTGSMDCPSQATVVLASDGMGQSILLRYLADRCCRHEMEKSDPAAGLVREFQVLSEGGSGRLADAARRHLASQVPGFIETLAILRSGLATEESFHDLLQDHHEAGLLPNDDSTLIIIDIDTTTQVPVDASGSAVREDF